MKTTSLKTIAIHGLEVMTMPEKFLERARSCGLDDQNQPVERRVSKLGGEPLRDRLRRARAGEEIILASFSQFPLAGPYREFGPIFIGAQAEPRQSKVFPVIGGDDRAYFNAFHPLVLRAYDRSQRIHEAVVIPASETSSKICQFLGQPEVWFVDARYVAFGCFACRFQRAGIENMAGRLGPPMIAALCRALRPALPDANDIAFYFKDTP